MPEYVEFSGSHKKHVWKKAGGGVLCGMKGKLNVINNNLDMIPPDARTICQDCGRIMSEHYAAGGEIDFSDGVRKLP